MSEGFIALPSIATQSPFSKVNSRYVGLSGASSGETVVLNMSLFSGTVGSNHGSSRIPAS